MHMLRQSQRCAVRTEGERWALCVARARHASDGPSSRSFLLATSPLHTTLRAASLRLIDAAYPRSTGAVEERERRAEEVSAALDAQQLDDLQKCEQLVGELERLAQLVLAAVGGEHVEAALAREDARPVRLHQQRRHVRIHL